jgi:hypothetical protein
MGLAQELPADTSCSEMARVDLERRDACGRFARASTFISAFMQWYNT